MKHRHRWSEWAGEVKKPFRICVVKGCTKYQNGHITPTRKKGGKL